MSLAIRCDGCGMVAEAGDGAYGTSPAPGGWYVLTLAAAEGGETRELTAGARGAHACSGACASVIVLRLADAEAKRRRESPSPMTCEVHGCGRVVLPGLRRCVGHLDAPGYPEVRRPGVHDVERIVTRKVPLRMPEEDG